MNEPVALSAPHQRRRAARFTIEQYYTIADTGVLDELGRTELIDGRIEIMSPQHTAHMQTIFEMIFALGDVVRGRSDLRIGGQGSIELGLHDVPEPDIFLYEPTTSRRGVPASAVKLVIEVAGSTARRDLGLKQRLYARHGIPEYWVVVLRTQRVERFAAPEDGRYTRHDSFGFDEAIASVTLPYVIVPAGLLPA